ncbi:hypothetical protein J7E99_17720 [Streptomyces sp. ISL-44]|uniref:hypothetical protein n=1 Tax=Streptomyces sp. ISL-44 TaxID=2819184 RepID=UPI001BEA7787|nr:hypothetical protein [Streptomyces sp. ISL-44]MBT2542505.1 hypothetical protein [Streptomyces sp. ISL-44]
MLAAVLSAAALLLSGCAEEKKPSAASQLPQSTCFGAFTPADLAPLLGNADEVKVDSPVDLRLTPERRGATCNIYVDGKSGVLATAERQPLGQGFFWPLEKVNPEPIPSVENGKVWDTGAAAGIACKGAKDSFELELWLSGSIDGKKAGESRALLTELMKQYADYAKQQTQCGV